MKKYTLSEVSDYKIYGRTDETQFPLPLFWNGSAIEVNVTGSELWIDVEIDFETYEPWVGTYLGGEFMSRQMLMPGQHSLCLFRGMTPETVKNVKFTRELQAMSEDDTCHILIYGFQTDGVFLPVKSPQHKIEFIGDSITSGEGTYGALDETDWIPMFMSADRNYALMTAKALDADYRLISQGGWGVLSGWDNNPYHNIPTFYEKICGLCAGPTNTALGATKPHDFTSWQPDIVVVNLGTNDCSAFEQPAWIDEATGETFEQRKNADGSYHPDDLARFEQHVIDFLKMLRKNNPEADIVWTYGMLGYSLTLPICNAINTYKAASGDQHVFFLQLPDTTPETVGSHAHPGFKSHQRAAQVLIEFLRSLL